jgi:hypothetical protein
MSRKIRKPQAAEVKSGWRGIRIVGARCRFLRYDCSLLYKQLSMKWRLDYCSIAEQTLVDFQNALQNQKSWIKPHQTSPAVESHP